MRVRNRLQIENCKLKIRVQVSGIQDSGLSTLAHMTLRKKTFIILQANVSNLQFAICNLQFAIFIMRLAGRCYYRVFCGTCGGARWICRSRNRSDPIAVMRGTAANRWTAGSYDVWLLKGNCRIQQGASDARCGEALLWTSLRVTVSTEIGLRRPMAAVNRRHGSRLSGYPSRIHLNLAIGRKPPQPDPIFDFCRRGWLVPQFHVAFQIGDYLAIRPLSPSARSIHSNASPHRARNRPAECGSCP